MREGGAARARAPDERGDATPRSDRRAGRRACRDRAGRPAVAPSARRAADRGGGPSEPPGRPARRGRSRRPPAGRGRPAPDRALADDRRTPSAEARTGGPGKRPRARAHARWRSRPGACPGALPGSAPAQRLRRTDRPSPRASRARRGRSQVVIREARKSDVPAVMPLFRRYCEFYEASPPDEGLERMARAIIAAPDDEAFLLVAEDG